MLMRARLLEPLDDPLADWARHRLGELGLGLHTVGAKCEGDGLRGDPPRELEASGLQSPSTLAESRLVAFERSAQDVESLRAAERLRRSMDVDG
jgi:hypothetical protein